MGQQVSDRGRSEAGALRDELVRTQVVVGRCVEVDEPLLPQLHHGDSGEGLRDRGDPEDRVLGDPRVRRDVGETLSREGRDPPVADDADREADGRMPVEDPTGHGVEVVAIEMRSIHVQGPRLRT